MKFIWRLVQDDPREPGALLTTIEGEPVGAIGICSGRGFSWRPYVRGPGTPWERLSPSRSARVAVRRVCDRLLIDGAPADALAEVFMPLLPALNALLAEAKKLGDGS